ncbi:tyrosine-type recombinase/integrase [Hyphococcus luteus]|uniref:Integrase n=1 Tax=Hyphococcus luteus TaxID=2058213 RepID=A0A2S7K3Q6_9PROT|nr:integrase arm-type DNA-binding domain-containing protein [Marinicaulis flavus]PQA87121.1 integrase [Marinicaulis flavus]
MKLTDLVCRSAMPGPKVRKLSDGGGLQLWVQPGGSRQWRLAYKFDGKQKVLAIGPYPIVSLAQAREARDEAKRLLYEGVDPNIRKKEQQKPAETFRNIAAEYVEKITREGRAERTLSKNNWLLGMANDTFGDMEIREIAAPKILEALRQVEARGHYESARRMRSTIGSVFRYAMATARADADPTIALRDALIRPQPTSRAAIIDPEAVGGLLRAVDGFEGHFTTRAGLQLMALLFPRPGELRFAEWSEFDFETAIWTVPASRMKMRRPHKSPLPRQSIEILAELRALNGGSRFVLPGMRSSDRPMSDSAMNAALRRMGFAKDEMTPHGFRATAATLLNETGKWHPDAVERQLAHIDENEIRRAYTRGEYWDERVRMMQWWADYLDKLKASGKREQNKVTLASPRRDFIHIGE